MENSARNPTGQVAEDIVPRGHGTPSEGTTILGFSGILFANHRGLNSMAWVAVIGMALALLASVVVLPLLLDLLSRRRGAERRGLQETEKRPR